MKKGGESAEATDVRATPDGNARTPRLADKGADPARRAFLGFGLGGVVATAAAAVTPITHVASTPAATGSGDRSGSGYRETDHVRNYYRTARL